VVRTAARIGDDADGWMFHCLILNDEDHGC
jgi:FtsP/CotA-like multicopper oxidase with cupredoxin domain